ncbi:MAG: hypothetical protein HW416_1756 [Chloroflexi bacterium]|nr:hypothetical protein [Chloroflexota bacterium]
MAARTSACCRSDLLGAVPSLGNIDHPSAFVESVLSRAPRELARVAARVATRSHKKSAEGRVSRPDQTHVRGAGRSSERISRCYGKQRRAGPLGWCGGCRGLARFEPSPCPGYCRPDRFRPGVAVVHPGGPALVERRRRGALEMAILNPALRVGYHALLIACVRRSTTCPRARRLGPDGKPESAVATMRDTKRSPQ